MNGTASNKNGYSIFTTNGYLASKVEQNASAYIYSIQILLYHTHCPNTRMASRLFLPFRNILAENLSKDLPFPASNLQQRITHNKGGISPDHKLPLFPGNKFFPTPWTKLEKKEKSSKIR